MITMIHAASGRTMEIAERETVKKQILERCGWAALVDIPEEEEQPNDNPKPEPKAKKSKRVTL